MTISSSSRATFTSRQPTYVCISLARARVRSLSHSFSLTYTHTNTRPRTKTQPHNHTHTNTTTHTHAYKHAHTHIHTRAISSSSRATFTSRRPTYDFITCHLQDIKNTYLHIYKSTHTHTRACVFVDFPASLLSSQVGSLKSPSAQQVSHRIFTCESSAPFAQQVPTQNINV